MTIWQECGLLIPATHPSAAGHFPGNPIVPGVLLLDAVMVAAANANSAVTIRNAKFLRPVRHGTPLRLRWQAAGELLQRFECTGPDGVVMAGMLAHNVVP
jgi:3-hydroxymyristoyl/3-hydroxydecanoyl-(acyl carrier protein) dehydratase